MSFDPTNKGFIAKNDKKEKDTHPDIKGAINIEGKEYWLSGWLKEKDGRKRYYVAATPKEAPKAKPAPQGSGFDDMPNDIPF